ncbi:MULTISPECIES: hypothetical protein [Streptomyces]|uniref:Amidase n=1 Tax=Streptomyces eurythermus TaxID=42237 RepID=A0ABW6Z4X1_9ACTN|nr:MULTISPECIES: hypothetical protein [Streptomyces]QIS75136.1 hypothetical protein HB370_38570 [Streptomyces sp. DSM 40868]
MGYTVSDIEKYGRAVDAGEVTLEEAVSSLVAASEGGLAPLGAADLVANWRTARLEYAEVAPDVLPDDPDHQLAFVKEYRERALARIADLDFAMRNGIIPARLQD